METGLEFTCGLTWYGRAYCWGRNDHGQLGNGTNGPGTDRNTPDAVAGGHHFIQITAGFEHACGLTRSGRAYCWGYNAGGQLGDSTTSPRNGPGDVGIGAAGRGARPGKHPPRPPRTA